MNGNETPLAPLAGKAVNEAFAGSNPAPRTIFPILATSEEAAGVNMQNAIVAAHARQTI
jgi:hypothetical protein